MEFAEDKILKNQNKKKFHHKAVGAQKGLKLQVIGVRMMKVMMLMTTN